VAPAAPAGVPPGQIKEWRRVTAFLRNLDIDLVIDVGANEGQYARGLRSCGYDGRIVSFEPVKAAYDVAAAHSRSDARWEVENLALGGNAGTSLIHVAANDAQSSSLLPMLARHEEAAPHAKYVDAQEVLVRRLDDALPTPWLGSTRAFLKIDTQGYESEVLLGAPQLLSGAVQGLQVELSLVPLYEEGPLYLDLIELLATRGFRMAQVIPGFSDPVTGEMLQFDGVFVRAG